MFYGYVRVSTETQAEHGGGLDVQTDAIKKYAEANGIELERIFTDAGISGTKVSRPALDELLIETIGEGDTIIVHNTSRLWRSIFAQAIIMKAVTDAKANIISIDEPTFDAYKFDKDPENFVTSSIIGVLDQWERMTITRKLARGRATKASKGDKPAGLCPYGYQYTADKKHVEVDEAEAAAVRLMFSEGQKGKSLSQIAATVSESYHTRRGGSWTAGSVQAILRNRFYVGELTHQGKIIAGNHPAIVSKVQFGKVAKQLDSRKRG